MGRHKRKSGLDIDLTPLLDVIFIVLMVVMCNRSLGENKEIAELTKENDQLKAENNVLKDQIYTEETKDDLVSYVVLYANYEAGNPKTRHVWLAHGDDKEIEDITITPETEEEKFNEFKEKLEEYVKERSDKPVLIVLDESRILYRDQQRLDGVLNELDHDNPNLYKRIKQE